jgi:hypothetical protein
MSQIERDYATFLASATADEDVVGLVVSGSRGAQAFVTDRSDYDVFLVLRQADDKWRFDYGSSVEIVALTVAAFETYALPGGHDVFRDLERLARGKGHGPGIDSWQPHLGWLLGDSQRNL